MKRSFYIYNDGMMKRKDNTIRFVNYDEPAFYEYEVDGSGKTITVKNKKLKMTITQRMSTYNNKDDISTVQKCN